MSNEAKNSITSRDLPITLYLNQRLTFDLLSSLEDGFSKVTSIQTTGESTSELSGEGKLGLKNVFALVGIGFSGKMSKTKEDIQTGSAIEEIVHTPTSLFSRLRKELNNKKLVRDISESSQLKDIIEGDFVEFEATLRQNPIDSTFSLFSEFANIMEITDDSNKTNTQRIGKTKYGGNPKKSNDSSMKKEIDSIYNAIKNDKSQDFIAELKDMKVILMTDKDYFMDPTMNDVIDGQFRIFGKVTRIITKNSSDTINLLRKSPIGKIMHKVPEIKESFSGIENLGFGSMDPEIKGPAMQVIPIAIFA